MGIFDVFKTKVSRAGEKVGDAAEQAKGKVSDLMDRRSDEPPAVADDPMAEVGIPADKTAASSEGASGGMTQSINDNVDRGTEKAGETAKGATRNTYDDKIDTGVQKAKDTLG
ncbi:MAG: antitoxin [Catenulispora sp.]